MDIQPNYAERQYGDIIRAEREKRGWTREELALKCNCSSGSIGNTEMHWNSYAQVETLCDVLDLDVTEMRQHREHHAAFVARRKKQSAEDGRSQTNAERHKLYRQRKKNGVETANGHHDAELPEAGAKITLRPGPDDDPMGPLERVDLFDDGRPRASIKGQPENPSMLDAAFFLAAIDALPPAKQKLVMNFITQLAEED